MYIEILFCFKNWICLHMEPILIISSQTATFPYCKYCSLALKYDEKKDLLSTRCRIQTRSQLNSCSIFHNQNAWFSCLSVFFNTYAWEKSAFIYSHISEPVHVFDGANGGHDGELHAFDILINNCFFCSCWVTWKQFRSKIIHALNDVTIFDFLHLKIRKKLVIELDYRLSWRIHLELCEQV